MYNLTETYQIIGPDHSHELWNGRYACTQSNGSRTFLTNRLPETVECYTFTLVRRGELHLETNGQELVFGPDDLYIYLPGFPVRILSATEDYCSTVLLVDEQTAYVSSAFRNLTRASFYPLVQYGKPRLSLSPTDARRLDADMLSIRDHILRPTLFSDETIEMLFSVFILDMIDIQEASLQKVHVPLHTEELFVRFYALARQNYVEHHDIGFYADQLHVTPAYLSRIVKHVTGHTVINCLDQMLATEATWLLTSTSLTVGQIADRLHFASTASFDRFFLRMRGQLPKRCRRR